MKTNPFCVNLWKRSVLGILRDLSISNDFNGVSIDFRDKIEKEEMPIKVETSKWKHKFSLKRTFLIGMRSNLSFRLSDLNPPLHPLHFKPLLVVEGGDGGGKGEELKR